MGFSGGIRVGRAIGAVVFAVVCLTPGLAPQAAASPLQAANLDFGGLARTYVLHVPPGVEHPTGLVVNLHAAGATGGDQEALTHYDAVADANGFVVVYPDGIDFSWADGRGASVPDRQGVDDVGFISTLVTKLVADYGIDPGHVFATGLSAGAFMANRLGCERADLFAAVAPVSGTLGATVPCTPSRPVAVMETHGTADPVVPFSGGPMTGRGGVSDIVSPATMVDRWRQVDGCQGAPTDEVLPDVGDGTQTHRWTSSGCKSGTAVVFMRVDGGGHTWPGAPEVLPVQEVGPPSHGFDASAASWRFFSSHAR
jgi:polyhydroxybutyrate depolymerase